MLRKKANRLETHCDFTRRVLFESCRRRHLFGNFIKKKGGNTPQHLNLDRGVVRLVVVRSFFFSELFT